MTALESSPMLELLAGFIQELREAGLPVSLTENLDAMEAVQHIPLEDREAFKYALAATLVKNNSHWRAFETVFEVYFSLRGRRYEVGEDGEELDLDDLLDAELNGQGDQEGQGMQGGGGGEGLSPEELAELLYQALMRGDDALMRAIARQAVKRFAGMEPGRPVGGTYYLYRTLRNLDLDGLLERLMEQAHQRATDTDAPLSPLEERLERDEYEIRIEHLKKEIEAEIRRRLVADRGIDAMAKTLRKPLPEDVDFMHASREEMGNLRKALLPVDPASRRAPRTEAAPRTQRSARLPSDGARVAQLRRRSGRAEVPLSASAQAGDLRHRRHLRLGGRVRPFHADARVCDQWPVLQGPILRVHRRHRRGDVVLRGGRGRDRGGASRQHRSRRRVGRRPLRLRACVRDLLAAVGQGDHPEDHRA